MSDANTTLDTTAAMTWELTLLTSGSLYVALDFPARKNDNQRPMSGLTLS